MPKKKTSQKSTPPDSSVPRRPDRDRRVRQSERIARVMGVLNLIQSRGRWNANAIADELECSVRTVYRDLEVLEFAGVPWYFDEREQCYRMRPDYRFPTLMLNEDEILGQTLATALTKAVGLDVGSGAGPTTRKLAGNTSEEVKEIFADASEIIEVFDLKLVDHSKHHEVIKTIQFALLNGEQIIGTYHSPYEEYSKKLTLHPYRLCLVKNAWYLIGHIDGETESKTFRIARFKSVRIVDQPSSIPESFSLQNHFGNAWSVYRGETSYQIELRFEPVAAKVVSETNWHHTQKVKHHKDGRATLSFTVDGLNEILNWILSWSGNVKVLAPIELKTRLFEALENALELNSEA